jgi:hypothetical protein
MLRRHDPRCADKHGHVLTSDGMKLSNFSGTHGPHVGGCGYADQVMNREGQWIPWPFICNLSDSPTDLFGRCYTHGLNDENFTCWKTISAFLQRYVDERRRSERLIAARQTPQRAET